MVLDFDRLNEISEQRRAAFTEAKPYPYTVIDDFLPVDLAEQVMEEFSQTADGWNHYHHYNEKKLALTDINLMGPATQKLFRALQSDALVEFMTRLTGVEGLISDPEMDGAGMHQIKRGGFLNVHSDFRSHTKNRYWSRQINLLIYFNKNWDESWGGNLELWDKDMTGCVESIAPVFNRCVIFRTIDNSFHGHPEPLTCPPDEKRKSIALYLFRKEDKACRLEPTNYQPRPQDSLKERILIGVDRGLVRVYSFAKRYAKLKDGIVDRILRHF